MLICGTLSMQFSVSNKKEDTQILIQNYSKELELIVGSLKEQSLPLKEGQGDIDKLKETVAQTRLAYKRLEFLLEYFYPHYVEEHINGAPLLHIKRHDTRPFVIPPEGLQVLDEMIHAKEVSENGLEISQLAQKLENHLGPVLSSLIQKEIQLQHLLEASRLELVRIFTLSLTGFDTPGSLNGIKESTAALEALQSALLPYFMDTPSKEIAQLLKESIHYLSKQSSFNDLDRLSVLKDYLDPLYKELGEWKHTLPQTASASPYIKNLPWNPSSQSLFDPNFLDPYFFTELEASEDSPALRALGKKLFYDKRLSTNQNLSCASCHKPELAFTDGLPKSMSTRAKQTVQRNSPTLLNAVYADRYFYDLRAFSLEQQAKHVVFNPHEFNSASSAIVQKLNQEADYKKLIESALGADKIEREELIKALSSYTLSLQSFNSNFDQYVRGEKKRISPKVKKGFNLFMGKAACGTCHFAPTFSGLVPPSFQKNETEILGVLENPKAATPKLDSDQGRIANKLYNEEAWIYEKSFKTVTVRNVELTAPYFHNGAYRSLEEVVDFYDHGGGAGLGLEVRNQTLAPDSLNLTLSEKEALITFMQSLTDTSAVYE